MEDNKTNEPKDEESNQKEALREEYHRLIDNLYTTVRCISKRTPERETCVYNKYSMLKKFCEEHKEFKLPDYPKSYNELLIYMYENRSNPQ